MGREYFCAYHSYIHQCKGLSDSELGKVFRALLVYSASGTLPAFKGRAAVAFDFISANIDRDTAQYEQTCKKNRDNVAKRYERIRSNTSECQIYQEKEKEEEKENYKKDLSDERSKKSAPDRKKFIPPTTEEVAAYCKQRKNSIDPDRFVDYYTAGGWKMGRQDMKDWKAAVRSWEKNGVIPKGRDTPEPKDFSFNLQDWEAAHKWQVPDFPLDEELEPEKS